MGGDQVRQPSVVVSGREPKRDPDREPVLRVEETHPGEERLRRHEIGLDPAPALVIREDDDPAVPDRNQTFTGRGGWRNSSVARA